MSLIDEVCSGNNSKRDLMTDIQKKPLPDVVLQRPSQPLDQQSSFNITSQPDDRINERQLTFPTKRPSYLNIKVEKTKKIRFLIQNQHNFYKVYRIQQIALKFIQKLKLQTNMLQPQKDNKMIRNLLYIQFRGVPLIGISQNQNQIKRILKNAQNIIQAHLLSIQQLYDISSIVIFSIFNNQIFGIDIILFSICLLIIIFKILEPVYIQGEEQPITQKLSQVDFLYLTSLLLQISNMVLQQQILLIISSVILFIHFIYQSSLKNLYEGNILKLCFRLFITLIMYLIMLIGLLDDQDNFQYRFFYISNQFFIGDNFKYQILDQLILFVNPLLKLYIISQLIIYVILNKQEIKNLRELKKIDQVAKQLQAQGFKKNLQEKVKSYLHNLVNQDYISQQKQYIQNYQQILPDDIKKDIMLNIQLQFLQKHSLFKRFTQSTLRKITQILITEEYNPKDVLLIDKDIDDCSIYLIHQGQCSINYPQEVGIHENEIIFSVGQSIGDIGFVTGLPRTATVVSNQFTKVFRLKRVDFLKIMQINLIYYFRNNFVLIRDDILFQNNFQHLDISCFCCKLSNHVLQQCPYLQYKPQRERIILQILNTVNKFRFKFNRYRRTKINTRSSNRYVIDKVEEIRNHLYYEDLENSSDYTVPASDNIHSLNRQFSSISKNTANKQSLSNPISQEQYVLRSVEKNSKDQFDQEFDELLRKDESFLQLDGQFQRKSGQKQTFATAGFGVNETGTLKSGPKNQMLVIDEKISDEQKSQSLNRSSDQNLIADQKKKQYMNASLSIKEYVQRSRQNNRSLTYTTPQSVSPNQSQKSIQVKLSPNLTHKQGSAQNLTNHMLPQSILDNEDNNNISIKSKSLSRYFSRSVSKKQSQQTKPKSNMPLARTIQSQQYISDFKPFSTVDNIPEQRLEFGLKNFERFQEYQIYYPQSNLSKVVQSLSKFQMYLAYDHKYSLWFDTRQQIKQKSLAYRVKR
ncbi:hypothetical protein pb186bvf_010215 [Paramecium bursaria]